MGLLKMPFALFEHMQLQERTFSVTALETNFSYWPIQLWSYIFNSLTDTTNPKVVPLPHVKTKEETGQTVPF